MTAPREILPDRIWFLTRRTTQRQFLLRPDEETTRIFDYCLAQAAERFNIDLIAWLVMSNHYHAVVRDRDGNLPQFMEHLHKMVAKAVNAHRERRENLWSSEEASAIYLPTPEDVFEKVVYTLTNPIADDLVDRVADWPGSNSYAQLQDATNVERARPEKYFAASGRMPATASLRATFPALARGRESIGEWTARVRAAISNREATLRAGRRREKRVVLGAEAVRDVSPFAAPKTAEPLRRGKLPCVACSNPERRRVELECLVRFLAAYREARQQFVAGRRNTTFPAGTYRFRALGARCAPYPNVRGAIRRSEPARRLASPRAGRSDTRSVTCRAASA